jgi:amidase
MNRRDFLQITALGLVQMTVGYSAFRALTPSAAAATAYRVKPFEWEEATVTQLQAAMKSGSETAVSLLKQYLRRIEEVDYRGPAIRSIIELNPDALARIFHRAFDF